MSDIQLVIRETANVSVNVQARAGGVSAVHVPTVPAIQVIQNGIVTFTSEGGEGGAQVLNDLTDVNAGSGAAQGAILFFNEATSQWEKGAYGDIRNIPNLAAVATSGSYNDLTDVPVSSDFSGDYNDLTNLPDLFDGDYNSLTNAPTVPLELNDLNDVDFSGVAPAHGQVLKYDSGSGTFKPADDDVAEVTGGEGTIGELDDIGDVSTATASQYDYLMYNGVDWINAHPKIDAQIVVSNTDGALGNAVGKTYAAGTDIMTILQDILTDYYKTTISLSNLKVQLQGTDGSYAATTTTTGTTREIGAGVKIVGFNFSIADNTQTADTSVSLKIGSTIIESGLSDSNFSPDLQAGNIQTIDPSTPASYSYVAHAVDNGSGVNIPINSGSRTISFKYRVRVGTSTTATITSDAEATTLFGEINDRKDSLMDESTFTVSGSADTINPSNYFWIAYPAVWGTLSDVLLGAVGSLVDFDNGGIGPVQYNVTNAYGVATSYYFYRTDSPGSIAESDNVTIQF